MAEIPTISHTSPTQSAHSDSNNLHSHRPSDSMDSAISTASSGLPPFDPNQISVPTPFAFRQTAPAEWNLESSSSSPKMADEKERDRSSSSRGSSNNTTPPTSPESTRLSFIASSTATTTDDNVNGGMTPRPASNGGEWTKVEKSEVKVDAVGSSSPGATTKGASSNSKSKGHLLNPTSATSQSKPRPSILSLQSSPELGIATNSPPNDSPPDTVIGSRSSSSFLTTNVNHTPVGNSPSWPFVDANGQRMLQIEGLRSPAIPLTPSAIHPSYAIPDDDDIIRDSGFRQQPRDFDNYGSANTSGFKGLSNNSKTLNDTFFSTTTTSNQGFGGYGMESNVPHSDNPYTSSGVLNDDRNATEKLKGFKFGRGGNESIPFSSSSNSPSAVDEKRQFYQPSGTPSLLSSRRRKDSPFNTPAFQRMVVVLDTPTSWLIMYFFFNLSLTLYNKSVMLKFPFPWTLTAVHTLCSAIGSKVAEQGGVFKSSEQVGPRESYTLFAFSVLYTINIAVSNLSLNLVSVPFHSVVRAMTPLFTIALSTMLLRKRYPQATYISLIPVVIGVAFTTLGEYDFTAWGLILTFLGVFLAAMKTVVTNVIQVGRLKLHPLDLLLRMSPLAFVQCVLWSWWTGELERVREYGATEMTSNKFFILAVNGAIAFGLNVVSFTANKKTSPLTMTVAANVKQVLSIVLAVFMFNVPMNGMKIIGILLTLIGGAWYAQIELSEKSKKARLTAATGK